MFELVLFNREHVGLHSICIETQHYNISTQLVVLYLTFIYKLIFKKHIMHFT